MKQFLSSVGRLIWRGASELPPMRQSCHVRYSHKGLLISAVHRDVRGMGPDGDPLALLRLDAEITIIGVAVLDALRGSRDGLSVEESEVQIARTFALAGEHTWQGFEREWEMIRVAFEDGGATVVLYQMHRYETGGYVMSRDDPVFRCPADPEEVGRVVRQIIDRPPLPVEPLEPSHA